MHCKASCGICQPLPTLGPTRSPSASPVVTNCQSNPYFKFMNSQNNVKYCEWIDTKEKREKYCAYNKIKSKCRKSCLSDCLSTASSPIGSVTPVKACSDSSTFTFLNSIGNRKDCKWIDSREKLDKYCASVGISSNCRKTCSSCRSLICKDDEDFKFGIVNTLKEEKCAWLFKGSTNMILQKRKDYCSGNILVKCANSCGECSSSGASLYSSECQDSTTFMFQNYFGKDKFCAWMRRGHPLLVAYKRERFCTTTRIKNQCRKSCDNCPTFSSTLP
jgi:hypothetical protein